MNLNKLVIATVFFIFSFLFTLGQNSNQIKQNIQDSLPCFKKYASSHVYFNDKEKFPEFFNRTLHNKCPDGVYIDANGRPVLTHNALMSVEIKELTGNYAKDLHRAKELLDKNDFDWGANKNYSGKTAFYYHEDGKTFLKIPSELKKFLYETYFNLSFKNQNLQHSNNSEITYQVKIQEPSQKEGFWFCIYDTTKQCLLGVSDVAVETTKGVCTMIAHPIDTAVGAYEGVSYAIGNPGETFDNIKATIIENSKTPRGISKMVTEGALIIIPISKAGKISKLKDLSKAKNIKNLPNDMPPAPSKASKIGEKLTDTKNIEEKTKLKAIKKLKYEKQRPKFRDGVVEQVWEKAKVNGKVYDPYTGEELKWNPKKSRKGKWDMGHKPGSEYRKFHQKYLDGEMTEKEFEDWYNNPDNYHPQSPSSNRSGKFEEK